jgi:thiol-disulfide isomerase/thioredoxin
LIIALAIVGIVLAIANQQAPEELGVEDSLIGEVAHAFELPLLAMEQAAAETQELLSLAEYSGNIVILDFWATTCAPCRRSIPFVERIGREYADDGVVVLSINVDFPSENRLNLVRAFARAEDIESDILIDNGNTAYQYGARRIPLLVMVGRDGNVARVYRGFQEYSVLADGIEGVIGS